MTPPERRTEIVKKCETLWSMEDVVVLIDVQANPADKRGAYKARAPKAA